MSTNLVPRNAAAETKDSVELVTMAVAGQLFGIPVLEIQDVINLQRITPVPLVPPEVAGSLNLRGRIVTAIDLRIRLGLPPRDENDKRMGVVVEFRDELYSLIIDKVGDVVSLPVAGREKIPATLDPRWQSLASGIYRLQDSLLVVLDVARILQLRDAAAA